MGDYYWHDDKWKAVAVSELQGQTLQLVEYRKGEEEVHFVTDDGYRFIMHHGQDCCEIVGVEEIVGNLADLVGTPIVLAEDVSSEAPKVCKGYNPDPEESWSNDDSFTWTFYRFRTIKGDVDIRWYGSSNGYYSESVDLVKSVDQGASL